MKVVKNSVLCLMRGGVTEIGDNIGHSTPPLRSVLRLFYFSIAPTPSTLRKLCTLVVFRFLFCGRGGLICRLRCFFCFAPDISPSHPLPWLLGFYLTSVPHFFLKIDNFWFFFCNWIRDLKNLNKLKNYKLESEKKHFCAVQSFLFFLQLYNNFLSFLVVGGGRYYPITPPPTEQIAVPCFYFYCLIDRGGDRIISPTPSPHRLK